LAKGSGRCILALAVVPLAVTHDVGARWRAASHFTPVFTVTMGPASLESVVPSEPSTNATFSGISSPSHRADSHGSGNKPLGDNKPPVDSHRVVRTHYDELGNFLVSYLAKGTKGLFVPSVLVFITSHTVFFRFRTCTFPTAKSHEGVTPAVPGTVHRCLR
jgi:hypothetical protein